MPTYQYRCPAGHEFERFEKMSGRPRTKCPQCGRTAVRVISGGAGLIFKGSGFYITDYGKDGKGPRKDTEASPAPEAAPAPPVTKDAPAPKAAGAEAAPAKKEKPTRKKDSG
jgi:putative FmdB family regulatory protein